MKANSVKTFLTPRTAQIVGLICGGTIFSGCVLVEKYAAEKARSMNFQRLLAQDERRMTELDSEVKRAKRELAEYERTNWELTAQTQTMRQEMASVQEENEAIREENETIKEAALLQKSSKMLASSLPDGYRTQVGERGMRLSGGERQRISLARAFLKDAPMLILDEPTSSVDVKSEAAITDAMGRLMRGRTTFMIAHRLTTLEKCDVRLHVEEGQVVPLGHDIPTSIRSELTLERCS